MLVRWTAPNSAADMSRAIIGVLPLALRLLMNIPRNMTSSKMAGASASIIIDSSNSGVPVPVMKQFTTFHTANRSAGRVSANPGNDFLRLKDRMNTSISIAPARILPIAIFISFEKYIILPANENINASTNPASISNISKITGCFVDRFFMILFWFLFYCFDMSAPMRALGCLRPLQLACLEISISHRS